MALNPYASPSANLEDSKTGYLCWREGNIVAMKTNGALPHRCTRCNTPVTTPVKSRRISWHSPAWFALAMAPLLYIIVAAIVSRRAKIAPALCAEHRNRVRTAYAILLGLLVLGVCSAFANFDPLFLIGIGLIGISLIGMIVISSRAVRPVSISDQEIRLKGFGEPFLDSLEARNW